MERAAGQGISEMLTSLGLDSAQAHWPKVLNSVTERQVADELANPQPGHYSLDRLMVLVSPAARQFIEAMAQAAHALTIQRFGKTMNLYAPLYVSNHCVNNCVYCGYNASNKFERTRLSLDDAMRDAEVIAAEGFRHILVVSGEDRSFVTIEYLCELARRLRKTFSSVSIEIHQLTRDEYAQLFDAGIDGVTLYQETFDRDLYKTLHKGPKADYERRLRAHDDAAMAGMRRLGLGTLLGLSDWRMETLALGVHAHYLMNKYWRSHISFSFPRMRPAHDVAYTFNHLLSDTDLVQMILALRLCFGDATLYLSTREPASLRDNLISLGITSISAGSKTNPGGYSGKDESVGQFEVNDDRSPAAIAKMIASKGYEPVWKDWDSAFSA